MSPQTWKPAAVKMLVNSGLAATGWKPDNHPGRPGLTADNSEQTTAFMVLGLVHLPMRLEVKAGETT